MIDVVPESPTVKGLFVGDVLEATDSLLEGFLEEYLNVAEGGGAEAKGDLKDLLDEVRQDQEPKVFRIAGNGQELQNVVLEPIRRSGDGAIDIAVLIPQLQPGETRWEILYTELAKAHQATIDFRQKLLAALPVLSGAGIGLLLANTGTNKDLAPWMLIPLGTLGVVVAFGLYLYEARNIQECQSLLERGAALEALAGASMGQFMFRPPKLALRKALGFGNPERGWISIEVASRVVYLTVMVAWLGVAIGGLVAQLR